MYSFGPNVRHIIDCHETNEEVIAKYKSQQLTTRHSIVCPSLIPLSPVALRNYEKETKDQLKDWLQDIQYVNSRVGLIYNFYPMREQGVDLSQSINLGEYITEAEEKMNSEFRQVAKSLI